MADTSQALSGDSIESPAVKRRRNPIRAIMLLATVAVAGFLAFILVSRRSNMEWYISPPVDAQGRRVHMLVPNGWGPLNGSNQWSVNDGSDSVKMLTLSPVRRSAAASFVARWLVKLRLTSPVPEGSVDLNLYRNQVRLADSEQPNLFQFRISMQGQAHTYHYLPVSKDVELGIVCTIDSVDRIDLAERICHSAYIK